MAFYTTLSHPGMSRSAREHNSADRSHLGGEGATVANYEVIRGQQPFVGNMSTKWPWKTIKL
jgi:hypothetical protein